jgi:hypothetical protein
MLSSPRNIAKNLADADEYPALMAGTVAVS